MEHTTRQWGIYTVLYDNFRDTKVKVLIVLPGKQLSMQRHFKRSEHWFVEQGTAKLYTRTADGTRVLKGIYNKFDSIHIDCESWHQLVNDEDKELKIIEIQYGTKCDEEDIERV